MKNTITTIFLFVLLWTSSASCQDFLVARVLEVNAGALELTVARAEEPEVRIVVQIATVNDLPRSGGDVVFPECAAPDATIRLWGSRGETDDSLFIATDIRGCGNGGCLDPTGIRSRLRKIRTHQYTSEDEGPEHSGSGRFGEDGSGDMGNGGGRGGGGGNGEGGGNGGGDGGGGGGNR